MVRFGGHCTGGRWEGGGLVVHIVNTIRSAEFEFWTLKFHEVYNIWEVVSLIFEGYGSIDLLSSYWWISNHPDAGSIIVTHLQTRAVLPLCLILFGPTIRSTQSLSHGIASASFSGKCPHFLCFFSFFVGRLHNCKRNLWCNPAFGPPKVLTDRLFSSVNDRVSKVMVIPFNYLFMFRFRYDNLFIVTYQLSHFACCMKWE
jgi:hypothetical protein